MDAASLDAYLSRRRPVGPAGPAGPVGPAYIPADGSIANVKLTTNPLARANHTGTQPASTITAEAWTAFTPTWGGLTVGDGTTACAYYRVGRLVIARYKFTLGATSAVTGLLTATLPVNAAANETNIGSASGFARDTSLPGNFHLLGYVANSTTAAWGLLGRSLATDVLTATSSTLPFVWAVGDHFGGKITYEAAS